MNKDSTHFMIYEALRTGAEYAITGRELAILYNCDLREITAAIERERRAGKAICANSGGADAGYFLAGSKKEMQNYCDRLQRRETEIYKTRMAMLAALELMPDTVEETAGA